MARHYVIQDWSNSATWSGEMIGDRLSKSKGHHFLKNGMANTEMYAGDEEDDLKKKSRVPLKARILPQASRVDKLRSEAIELEAAYKAGEFTAEEYTLLRDVQFKKIHRAEELLKKAITPVQKEKETREDGVEMYTSSYDMAQDDDGCKDEPLAWLSDRNSLKKILQNTCKAVKGVVHFSQKAKSYWNELKEV